jgi:hypothetical protein
MLRSSQKETGGVMNRRDGKTTPGSKERLALTRIGKDNFYSETSDEQRPLLLACLHESPEFDQQAGALDGLSRVFGDALKVCLLDPDCIDTFSHVLQISGTPTFLIFRDGHEKGRLLGLADGGRLAAFVVKALPFLEEQ